MYRILVLLLLSQLSVVAQETFSISGKVTSVNEQPVIGASVYALNRNTGTATNNQGNFELTGLSSGNYTLRISAVGFVTTIQEVAILNQDAVLAIQLREAATELDAVTVTAQKVEEDLLHVPISVSALSAVQVQEYRLWNVDQLSGIAPNVYSANPGDNRNVTSVRGITSTSYDPAVATYVDGVNQFGLDTYIAQLHDIERIEVLRGPQGTLYGRNAMGGVINIITKKPSNERSAFAEVHTGNYGQQRYGMGVRMPLEENKLFVNASLLYDRSNGFYTNVFDQSDFDKKKSMMVAMALTYVINPSWNIAFSARSVENQNDGAFPLAYGALDNPFEVNQNAITTMVDDVLNSSLSVQYSGKRFNFSSQTAAQSNYRYYTEPIDGDFSPLDAVSIINDYGTDWNNVKVLTQEFKFTSPATATTLKWNAGAYAFYQYSPVKQAIYYGADAPLIGAPDTDFSTISTSTGKSAGAAIFGQATYNITERFHVLAGLRMDYERKQQRVKGEYQKDPDPAFATVPDTTASATFHAFSPKLGVGYAVNENGNLYATYSRGFRPGGLTQLSPDPSQPALYKFDPEYSNTIEVLYKQVFFENRLRATVATFYTVANDVQVPTLVLPDAITVTRNAGKLVSKGIEAEISASVEKLQLEYHVGCTDASYKTLNLSTSGGEVNLNGNRQLFTPQITSMLAMQYNWSLSNIRKLDLVARAEWFIFGDQYFDLANSIRQSAYQVINTRLGVSGKHVELMWWMRNLRNEHYIAYAYDFGAAHLGDPRNYGVTLSVRF